MNLETRKTGKQLGNYLNVTNHSDASLLNLAISRLTLKRVGREHNLKPNVKYVGKIPGFLVSGLLPLIS